MTDTVTLRNSHDTYATQAVDSRNYSDRKQTSVSGAGGAQAVAYYDFNFPAPRGTTITNAVFRVAAKGAWTGTNTLIAKAITESWKSSKLTWANRPAVSTTNQVTVVKTGNADGYVFEFDVTAMMQAVADGTRWFGIRLELDTTTARFLYSSESVGNRPTMEMSWTEAPQAPTVLSPSGGRSVSVAKPVLRFDFTDNAGSDAMSALQVQVNATNVWTSPTFDSGTVAAVVPELDLTATAYAGLSNAAETYWRVRVQDGAGLWSLWSDGVLFRRDNKGTLTLSNPSAGNPFVSERTPPLIWSLAGETQVAYQVMVVKDDDPTIVRYDSGKTKGADVSLTLPRGVLTNDSVTYRWIHRVWDSKDREATPGDPRYTTVSLAFTYSEDGTPNPVTALVAVNTSPTPYVVLTWSRATAPDYFAVLRDGDVIEQELEAVDAFVSGTSYTFTDYEATPFQEHVYKVEAVVRGTGSSSGNPTVTITPESHGIWIIDPDRPTVNVCVTGNDGSFAAPDDAGVFKAKGSDIPVRIISGLSSLSGSITGDLVAIPFVGVTAKQWEARMNQVKERPTQVYKVHVGSFSMRCVIGDVMIGPSPADEDVRQVSFSFWQVGPLPFDTRL